MNSRNCKENNADVTICSVIAQLVEHRTGIAEVVAASAPVGERSVKLKGLMTHRFHKAQVY